MKFKPSFSVILIVLVISVSGIMSNAHGWPLIDDPGPLVHVEPKILIGYMPPISPTTLEINILSNKSTIRKLYQSSRIEGLWAELVTPVKSATPIGFTLSFGYLFPGNYHPYEIYYGSNGQVAERSWNTSTTLFNLKFTIDYSFSQSVTGILGFHYDSFMVNFLEPENMIPNGTYFNSSQGAAINITGGSPFAGLMYDRSFWAGANVKAYFIGYPGLPCVLSYDESLYITGNYSTSQAVKLSKEISSGYFFEGFAEISIPVWRGIGAGSFFKYSQFSGKVKEADVRYKKSEDNGDDSVSAEVIYLRNSWIIGGVIAATF